MSELGGQPTKTTTTGWNTGKVSSVSNPAGHHPLPQPLRTPETKGLHFSRRRSENSPGKLTERQQELKEPAGSTRPSSDAGSGNAEKEVKQRQGQRKKEQGTADHELPSTHGLASQLAANVHCRRTELPGSVLCVPVQHLHAFSLLAVACLHWLRKGQRGLRRLQVPLSMSQQQQSEQSSRALAAVGAPAHPPHRSDAH